VLEENASTASERKSVMGSQEDGESLVWAETGPERLRVVQEKKSSKSIKPPETRKGDHGKTTVPRLRVVGFGGGGSMYSTLQEGDGVGRGVTSYYISQKKIYDGKWGAREILGRSD